ncbi:acyl-CoA dehydrogenase family protein [Streptomyces noursei]|uniref:acyl-CoA dehydrogenase family protein n=1 Tax=Streptomyces noursei TaxID=1971 RepID=UPI001F397B94|nr:acyl-CoA dehydrogenase family protein [Streptomyces noursei]MCE4947368.1 acyl-CoA dehydrogenase family protein [Streptomyces noursei]
MPDSPPVPASPPTPDQGTPPAPPAARYAALDALPATATGAEVWAALGRAGLLTRAYRDGAVTAGTDPDGLADLLTAVDARFSIPATLSASVQLATALPVLAAGRTPLARQALDEVLSGRATVTLAATDATTGTDLAALRTEVRIADDGLTLTGTKRWIANTTTAAWHLVLARHRPGRHFTHFTWVLVPADAPGVTVRAADSALFAPSGTGHLTLDDVRLDRDHLVGRTGFGLPLFARHIATERLAGAQWGVALCRRVLADTHRHLTRRPHGEGTLWDLDPVRQRFAACLVRVRELHALAADCADAVALRHDATAAAALKAAAGSTVNHVLAACGQLWGAEGFTTGGIQEIRAQAALFDIGGGAGEVVLGAVADTAEAALDGLVRPGTLP